MSNRITKRDEARQSEITIVMNDNQDVIGVEINLFQPISLVDFNFEKLFAPSSVIMNTRMAQQLWAAAGQPGLTSSGNQMSTPQRVIGDK